ncbi:UNVERIFIED_CONTAM: hypothetical protein K2H54_047123 [Gekko kuhli]
MKEQLQQLDGSGAHGQPPASRWDPHKICQVATEEGSQSPQDIQGKTAGGRGGKVLGTLPPPDFSGWQPQVMSENQMMVRNRGHFLEKEQCSGALQPQMTPVQKDPLAPLQCLLCCCVSLLT